MRYIECLNALCSVNVNDNTVVDFAMTQWNNCNDYYLKLEIIGVANGT